MSDERQFFWSWSVPLYIWLFGIFTFCGSWCIRKEHFAWIAIGRAIFPTTTAALQIGAATLSMNTSMSLITASIIGQTIATLFLFTLIAKHYRELITASTSLKSAWIMAKEYQVYPIYMAPRSLLGNARDRLIYFMLDIYGTMSAVGFFGLAQRIINIPGTLLAGAARPVFFEHAARQGIHTLENLVLLIIRTLSFLIIPFWIIFLYQSEMIFGFVLGEEWQPVGFYAALLTFPAIPNILGNWLDRTFDVTGKQRTAFLLELGFSIAAITGVLVSVFFFEEILIAVYTQIVIMTLYNWYFLYRIFIAANFSIGNFWKLVRNMIGYTLVWTLLTWGVLAVLEPYFANGVLLISACVGCALYLKNKSKILRDLGREVAS